MQLVGFNLKKIKAEKSPEFKRSNINTNIEFTDVLKEKLELLKDADAVRISFIFTVSYTEAAQNPNQEKKEKEEEKKHAEVLFDGDIMLSSSKDESKELFKSWKKKQIPEQFRIPLINFILKRCSVKALSLEEELNLPAHIPFPQVRKPNQDSA